MKISIAIIGNERVGKSAIRRNYLGQSFQQNYQSTLGIDVTVKDYQKGGISATISLWDMGGQAFYRNSRSAYYMNAAGIILVFDVTEEFAYKNQIEVWLQEKEEFTYDSSVPTIILANKIDLAEFRQVSNSDLEILSTRIQLEFNSINQIPIFETSAKTGIGIEKAFELLISNSLNWIQRN